ncbi:MAG: MFS transporter, partial [Chloroflexota bacterium]
MTAVGFSSIIPFLPLYVEFLGSSTSLSLKLLAGMVNHTEGRAADSRLHLWPSRHPRTNQLVRAVT